MSDCLSSHGGKFDCLYIIGVLFKGQFIFI